MRQVTKKGLITVAAAGGVLALSGGTAFADSGAQGAASDSPGVLSGNTIQLPVHVPVNLCGNTIDVVGLLNPAFGNTCVNDDSGSEPKPETPHTPEPPKAETPSEEPEAPSRRRPSRHPRKRPRRCRRPRRSSPPSRRRSSRRPATATTSRSDCRSAAVCSSPVASSTAVTGPRGSTDLRGAGGTAPDHRS
ncbi:chaplin [Streptomyces sp. Z26]|uniref:chaplin n=1 Tax=Streptomyces sp. Z26 TaxID=2500177 RepID=UPI0026CCB72C